MAKVNRSISDVINETWHIKGLKLWTIRMMIAVLLVRLSCWVAGTNWKWVADEQIPK
jgi:hypothetical protein